MNLRDFLKNPYDSTRKTISNYIAQENMSEGLSQKFAHTSFEARFILIYYTCIIMKYIIQATSIVTAFFALSYLMDMGDVFLSSVIAIVLAVVIEIIKRPAIDDVFKNLFQYKTLSKFALFVAFFVTAVSIDLSLRGAEKAPYIVIANPVYQAPTLALADPIRKEYEQREAALVTERERYRKQREWKGRIATKDANYIKELNRKIASTIASKDTALIQLKQDNEALIAEAKEKYKQEVIATNQKRQKYGNTLIWVQLIAEILYILFSIIEWAYSWEVMKESKIPAAIAAAAPQEDGSRTQKAGPAPPSDHQTAGTRTAAVPSGTADDPNKERRQIGFKQQQLPEIEVEHIKQIEFIEKEYTRICEHCGNGYVHKASNQKYCTTQCKKNAARLREAARKGQ